MNYCLRILLPLTVLINYVYLSLGYIDFKTRYPKQNILDYFSNHNIGITDKVSIVGVSVFLILVIFMEAKRFFFSEEAANGIISRVKKIVKKFMLYVYPILLFISFVWSLSDQHSIHLHTICSYFLIYLFILFSFFLLFGLTNESLVQIIRGILGATYNIYDSLILVGLSFTIGTVLFFNFKMV